MQRTCPSNIVRCQWYSNRNKPNLSGATLDYIGYNNHSLGPKNEHYNVELTDKVKKYKPLTWGSLNHRTLAEQYLRYATEILGLSGDSILPAAGSDTFPVPIENKLITSGVSNL